MMRKAIGGVGGWSSESGEGRRVVFRERKSEWDRWLGRARRQR